MLPCALVLAPCFAGVAQLVEHHLAKVDVESSSLFARSILLKPLETSPAVFSRPNATSSASCVEALERLLATAPASKRPLHVCSVVWALWNHSKEARKIGRWRCIQVERLAETAEISGAGASALCASCTTGSVFFETMMDFEALGAFTG